MANYRWHGLGQTGGYYKGDLVAVGGASGWWKTLISDLFFNAVLRRYDAVHGLGEHPSELRERIAMRQDAENWAGMARELMEAAGVDAEWLVDDFFKRL